MSEAMLWYWRNGDQRALPEVGENVVVLSPEFYREITTHPIPTDLQAARALSSSPAALDLYNWLSHRCHIAKREHRVPLFGPIGLTAQLGIAEYARARKFRERLEQWLRLVNLMWPECPAHISLDGKWLLIGPASPIVSRETWSGAAACDRGYT
jgi:Plasmid encoded RepA protein